MYMYITKYVTAQYRIAVSGNGRNDFVISTLFRSVFVNSIFLTSGQSCLKVTIVCT